MISQIIDYNQVSFISTNGEIEDVYYITEKNSTYVNEIIINGQTYNVYNLRITENEYKSQYENKDIHIDYLEKSFIVINLYKND